MLIIAGICNESKYAEEIEDIVKTSIVSNRIRELYHTI